MPTQIKARRKRKTPTETTAKAEEKRFPSRAVAKAFGLLRVLGREGEALGLARLSAEIKLNKSSTIRLLQTLQELHQVTQDSEGRYSLVEDRSSRYVQVASAIIPIARPFMQSLQMRFKETVSLAVLFNNHIEVMAVIESPHIVRMANTVGRILPPHASSLGKAITAFQPDAVAQQLFKSYGLPRLTAATLTDEIAIVQEMQATRQRGYSLEVEETVADGCCFGSPVMGSSVAVAAMSISMPKSRAVQGKEREQLLKALNEATAAISAQLCSILQSPA